MKKFTVTISRQFGSLGRPIARELSEKLGVEYYDRDIVEMTAEKHGISLKEASNLEEKASNWGFMRFPLGFGTTASQDRIFKTESEIIKELAEKNSCIIVGRCADAILGDHDNNINIYICAPYEDRIVNCVNDLGMDVKQAKRMISEVDKARDAYHMRYVKYHPNDPDHIDLMVNSSLFGVHGTADFLAEVIKRKFDDKSAASKK